MIELKKVGDNENRMVFIYNPETRKVYFAKANVEDFLADDTEGKGDLNKLDVIFFLSIEGFAYDFEKNKLC